MLRVDIETLLEVTSGELLAGPADAMVNGLAVDSRDVQPGSAFVAFLGERVDGHTFLAEAVLRGARALVVTRDDDAIRAAVAASRHQAASLILVDDALAAVQALAAHHRERLMCPVVGVTGSTGKTTTKDLIEAALSSRLNVVATHGNRNNELGVPLTLFEAGADTEVVVVEMAMRGAGQIGRLCEIARPTHGLVTNVGVSHIELLGSAEAIADAKGELVEATDPAGAVYLNGDDALSERLEGRATARVVTYGLQEGNEVRAEDISVSAEGTASFVIRLADGASQPVALRIPGRHNVYNALGAAALSIDLGLTLEETAEGLGCAVAGDMRMQTFTTAGGVTVVNDAYNANPTSMRAALNALDDMAADGKKIVVLGDMAELGSLAELAHFQLGEQLAHHDVDLLITVGDRAVRIADGARAQGMAEDVIRPCVTVEEASSVLEDVVEPGDLVLLKASRVVGLERVAEGIVTPHAR